MYIILGYLSIIIMTSFIDALDNYTANTTCFGENGHNEYNWSDDFQEKICQFHFQLVRTKSNKQLDVLADILRGLLRKLKLEKPIGPIDSGPVNDYLRVLYCLLAQTRDIIDGKGECQLSYMMLLVWYEFFPEMAIFALETFVHSPIDNQSKVIDSNFHPYGSWKDMKYFANYCKLCGCADDHPFILRIINLINTQLHIDNLAIDDPSNNTDLKISLVAKWVPRQSSNKFGWLNKLLAMDYYRNIMSSVKVSSVKVSLNAQYISAQTKCIMLYRKMLSKINAHLDTIQIKQCADNWSSIDHAKTTSVTFIKQSKALYNVDKNGKQRSYLYDRIQCANQLKEFVSNRIQNNKEIKGGRVEMVSFTKNAIELIKIRQNLRFDKTYISQIELLNSQWRDSSLLTGELNNFIAMVDTSASMTWDGGDPYNVAVSLGIRVAEKSSLGKRIMTFSNNPTWVQLSGNYIDMVEQIRNTNSGMGTNFYKALDLILTACCQNNVLPTVVAKMVLVIFSDMQLSEGDSNYKSMYAGIVQKYQNAGYNQPPHILFWNLRSTSGFPTLMREPNVSTMSGFSPALLNQFCEKGFEGLAVSNPWSTLVNSLFTNRYKQMIKQI